MVHVPIPRPAHRATLMASTPLYRPEVIEAQRNRWLGRLIVRQPVSHWVLTWCAIALVGVAIVFLAVGEYAQKVRVDGQLVVDPGPIGIAAPGAGMPASLEAELYLPDRLLESSAVGSEVLLRYDAFPYQHYGQYRGRIVRIADSPLPASHAGGPAGDGPLYLAVVALNDQNVHSDGGRIHALRPGQRLQADIVLEKRRLYEWILEPLARWRGRNPG